MVLIATWFLDPQSPNDTALRGRGRSQLRGKELGPGNVRGERPAMESGPGTRLVHLRGSGRRDHTRRIQVFAIRVGGAGADRFDRRGCRDLLRRSTGESLSAWPRNRRGI